MPDTVKMVCRSSSSPKRYEIQSPERFVAPLLLAGAAITFAIFPPPVGVALATLAGLLFVIGAARKGGGDGRGHQRSARRRSELQQASAQHRGEYETLEAMVDEIERRDPDLAERLSLQLRLDDYVCLAVSAFAQRQTAAMVNEQLLNKKRQELESGCDGATSSIRRKHREILDQHLEHRRDCLTRARQIEAELAMLADFLHLITVRTTIDPVPESIVSEVSHNLESLRETDETLRELAA